MIRFILGAILALGMSSVAIANELDNESGVTNKELTGTLVLRVDSRTNEASYVKTDAVMTSEAVAVEFIKTADFKNVPVANMKAELDKDGGSSSWYFYYAPYSYPYYTPMCNWYGSYYNPYYSYGYGYYNYYYYGSYWSYWR